KVAVEATRERSIEAQIQLGVARDVTREQPHLPERLLAMLQVARPHRRGQARRIEAASATQRQRDQTFELRCSERSLERRELGTERRAQPIELERAHVERDQMAIVVSHPLELAAESIDAYRHTRAQL